jgi:hypothetical protein
MHIVAAMLEQLCWGMCMSHVGIRVRRKSLRPFPHRVYIAYLLRLLRAVCRQHRASHDRVSLIEEFSAYPHPSASQFVSLRESCGENTHEPQYVVWHADAQNAVPLAQSTVRSGRSPKYMGRRVEVT